MPTFKQKLVAERIIKNKGNVSKSMKEAGYSAASAKNPKNLTQSKGFKEILEKAGITDKLAAKKHYEFLNTPKRVRVKVKGELIEETEELAPIGLKALELYYKITDKMRPDPEVHEDRVDPTLESMNTLINMINEDRKKGEALQRQQHLS